jgi:hypothetical protein
MKRPETVQITRATARARDPDAPCSVLRVRVPEGSALRRRPVALVDVQLGPVVLAVTVARRQRRGWLEVLLPTLPGINEPAVDMPDDLAEAVHEMALAAVRADPEAARLLR